MKEFINSYKALMIEIAADVAEGVITEKDTIQVLRAQEPVVQDYCPIKEWYYDAYAMKQELELSLEEMYLKEEFSDAEWEDMKVQQEEYRKQYEADQPNLTEISVKDVLTEMKQMVKLFG